MMTLADKTIVAAMALAPAMAVMGIESRISFGQGFWFALALLLRHPEYAAAVARTLPGDDPWLRDTPDLLVKAVPITEEGSRE